MYNCEQGLACRACGQQNTEEVVLVNVLLPPKESTSWSNRFCSGCGGISHYYREPEALITYTDSQYRDRHNLLVSPVPLPWSAVSFERYLHMSKLIGPYIASLETGSASRIEHLDFGGYNGFTSFGLSQVLNIHSTIADLDLRGLRVAGSLGMPTIDLSAVDLPVDEFQLVTAVHVLEHLESPLEELGRVHSSMSTEGAILYCEVPNILGTPTIDPSHLSAFSAKGLVALFERAAYEVLEVGHCTTPSVAREANWSLFSSIENLFLIASNANSSSASGTVRHRPTSRLLNSADVPDVETLYSRLYLNGSIIRIDNSLRYLGDAGVAIVRNVCQIAISVTILLLPTTRLKDAVSMRLLELRRSLERGAKERAARKQWN